MLRQLGNGSKVQGQIPLGFTLLYVKQQEVGTDMKRQGHLFEHVQRRLGLPGLILLQAVDVDADGVRHHAIAAVCVKYVTDLDGS